MMSFEPTITQPYFHELSHLNRDYPDFPKIMEEIEYEDPHFNFDTNIEAWWQDLVVPSGLTSWKSIWNLGKKSKDTSKKAGAFAKYLVVHEDYGAVDYGSSEDLIKALSDVNDNGLKQIVRDMAGVDPSSFSQDQLKTAVKAIKQQLKDDNGITKTGKFFIADQSSKAWKKELQNRGLYDPTQLGVALTQTTQQINKTVTQINTINQQIGSATSSADVTALTQERDHLKIKLAKLQKDYDDLKAQKVQVVNIGASTSGSGGFEEIDFDAMTPEERQEHASELFTYLEGTFGLERGFEILAKAESIGRELTSDELNTIRQNIHGYAKITTQKKELENSGLKKTNFAKYKKMLGSLSQAQLDHEGVIKSIIKTLEDDYADWVFDQTPKGIQASFEQSYKATTNEAPSSSTPAPVVTNAGRIEQEADQELQNLIVGGVRYGDIDARLQPLRLKQNTYKNAKNTAQTELTKLVQDPTSPYFDQDLTDQLTQGVAQASLAGIRIAPLIPKYLETKGINDLSEAEKKEIKTLEDAQRAFKKNRYDAIERITHKYQAKASELEKNVKALYPKIRDLKNNIKNWPSTGDPAVLQQLNADLLRLNADYIQGQQDYMDLTGKKISTGAGLANFGSIKAPVVDILKQSEAETKFENELNARKAVIREKLAKKKAGKIITRNIKGLLTRRQAKKNLSNAVQSINNIPIPNTGIPPPPTSGGPPPPPPGGSSTSTTTTTSATPQPVTNVVQTVTNDINEILGEDDPYGITQITEEDVKLQEARDLIVRLEDKIDNKEIQKIYQYIENLESANKLDNFIKEFTKYFKNEISQDEYDVTLDGYLKYSGIGYQESQKITQENEDFTDKLDELISRGHAVRNLKSNINKLLKTYQNDPTITKNIIKAINDLHNERANKSRPTKSDQINLKTIRARAGIKK